MSDSVRPHRRQPTRLPRPWDSPGKNTGVGCHALPQGIFPTQRGSRPSKTRMCSCTSLRNRGMSLQPQFLSQKKKKRHLLGISLTNSYSNHTTLYKWGGSDPQGRAPARSHPLRTDCTRVPSDPAPAGHRELRERTAGPGPLGGESQGRGSLVGCRLRGRTESDTTEVT